jgi:LPS export ABC transporter protein LptC
MEARGNVVVVTKDGRRLLTEQLRYDPSRNEVSSDVAFTLTEPQRSVEGVGFIADPNLNNIRILSAARATGQPITIPRK